MAKPKSEDKRNAILASATKVFAERGLSAPTAAITSAARVAEGSLFTYFKTKDELINALYLELKLELRDAMMSGFPRKLGVRSRLEHVWNGYVDWGSMHPEGQQVLRQIQVWGGLTENVKAASAAAFGEFDRIAEDATAQKVFRDLPMPYVWAALATLADMTMDFMRRQPEQAAEYRAKGFELFWSGVGRK
jgi:AcrR family transcriptional regulator